MEDRNVLAADCIVLCCCCQCMILQILILILTKLPRKLLRKTKEYAKKFRARKRGMKKKKMIEQVEEEMTRSSFGSIDIVDDFCFVESLEFGCCMSEVETVLDEFSSRGEFAFGSFWGGDVSSSRSFHSCFKFDHLDYEVVGYHLIELFGTADLSKAKC